MKTRLSVGFVSLGCPKNLVDTENMMAALGDDVTLTADEKSADVVVINTCGFLEPAKQESLSTIGEFAQKKQNKKLKGLVVAGCMTERFLKPMAEKYPEIDAFIRTGEFSKIKEIVSGIQHSRSDLKDNLIGEVEQLKGHSEMTDFVERLPLKRSFAYVKISEGCNRVCSFCIIPKLRGKHHSRSIKGILDEVSQLVQQGTKEIIFIAQDLTSYGRDLKNDSSLLELLKRLETVKGEFWYRLMYNYPRFFTDELIDLLAESPRFSGYIDMPLQHFSDPVLKAMKRPESSKEIRSLVEKLRSKISDLSLRTTMMVGFPGETEEDFEKLLAFVSQGHFDHLGAFTFYAEKGTPAFDHPNQIPEAVKKERYARLMTAQKEVQAKRLNDLMDSQTLVMIDVLAEKTRQGFVYKGRTQFQCPDIDGLTYVVSDRELGPGDLVEVEIQKTIGDYDLLSVDLDSQLEDFVLPVANL